MAETTAPKEVVNLTIDGKQVTVPKGTNLIDAAKTVGVSIPYYCYHPHLSIAGNCRMCQVRVTGAPKMEIACNTAAREGMEVKTQMTSQEVKDTQAAVLEFILINHPLDCTVCDQAGHCKLQDYHYEYNARPSRFLENKEHKVKAEPLGPTVMLDGERCIMCTRCIRFCDEVTETSELGMLNRGDRSVISVNPGKELTNPLSGSVVDLCPVGALTHREWRFNTRIWFTKETDSICPGCSTGCNVRVAVRDRQVVQVKGRLNSQVNKEWMCDEGRYGFGRFLPDTRLLSPRLAGADTVWDKALAGLKKLSGQEWLVFISPDLLLEEMWMVKSLIAKFSKQPRVAVAYRERPLSKVEKILISPDYAANFKAAELLGLVGGDLAEGYDDAILKLKSGVYKGVLLFGDRSILPKDLDDAVAGAIARAETSVAILCDASTRLATSAKVVLPGRSVLEKSGMMVNRSARLQYSEKAIDFPLGTESDSRIIGRIAEALGSRLAEFGTERDLSLHVLKAEPLLAGLKIATIKAGGVQLQSGASSEAEAGRAAGA